jgi:hypothetical protein
MTRGTNIGRMLFCSLVLLGALGSAQAALASTLGLA